MYCKVCSEASKSNRMRKEAQCRNSQNTTLNWHIGLLEHKMALQGPEKRKSLEEAREKAKQSRIKPSWCFLNVYSGCIKRASHW